MILKPGFLKKFSKANSVVRYKGGVEYFNKITELINHAQDEIHLQIYIFELDNTGIKIAEALKNASQRGVEISILVDAYGCSTSFSKLKNYFKDTTIHLRQFSPINYKKLKIGRRLHQKVLVIDRVHLVVGGINIAERYCGTPNQAAWLDFAVVIQSNHARTVAKWCNNLMQQTYFSRTNKRTNGGNKSGILVRVLQHDWVRRKPGIFSSYKHAIRTSTQSIDILASYFMPGFYVLRMLRKSSRRGVKIRLILPSVTDATLLKRASNYLYYWLMRNNIEIYEYAPQMMHAKIAIVDKHWATIGSYNLINLSKYSSIEMNVEILDTQWVGEFAQEINEIIKNDCTQIFPSDYLIKRGYFGIFIDRISYYTMYLGFWILKYLTAKQTEIQ